MIMAMFLGWIFFTLFCWNFGLYVYYGFFLAGAIWATILANGLLRQEKKIAKNENV
jgi:hypothetical protein